MKTSTKLVTHPEPDSIPPLANEPSLRIEGLVSHPCLIKLADLATLPRASFTENFSCDEQWVAKDGTALTCRSLTSAYSRLSKALAVSTIVFWGPQLAGLSIARYGSMMMAKWPPFL